MTFAVFGVSVICIFVVSQFVAMAEPNQSQPIEPTEPERYQTETDDVSQSSTSSGGDVPAAPQVQVEPPLTKTQPPIFYIPIPSPGDPVPLIPTKPFVRPKSVFLSDFAVQSTLTGEPTEPNQGTDQPSGSGQALTDSDVDITTFPVRPMGDDVDIPVLSQPPAVGKPVPSSVRPQRIAKSSFDVDSKTPVPALGRVIWSSTDVPKSVFMPNVQSAHVYPPVAFGEFTNAVNPVSFLMIHGVKILTMLRNPFIRNSCLQRILHL